MNISIYLQICDLPDILFTTGYIFIICHDAHDMLAVSEQHKSKLGTYLLIEGKLSCKLYRWIWRWYLFEKSIYKFSNTTCRNQGIYKRLRLLCHLSWTTLCTLCHINYYILCYIVLYCVSIILLGINVSLSFPYLAESYNFQ